MPWKFESDTDYDYRFLRSGELEFRGRGGRYHRVGGCSVLGIFEFEERLEELREIAADAPDHMGLNELFATHDRFRYLCLRLLELNGIEPDWVSPREMRWLLFAREECGALIEPPLQTLNTPPKPRHPTGQGKGGKNDRVALIAAVATHCGGNLDTAYEIAKSQPFRELMAVMEESAWLQKSPEERRKAEFTDWATTERQRMRAERPAMQNAG